MYLFYLVSSEAAELILTQEDMRKLINLIHNFSSKWYYIGLGLGFISPELDNISSNPMLLSSAPDSYLTKLLSQWVQWPTKYHPTKPTLRALCEALHSSPVGLGSLADKVEKEMIATAIPGKDRYFFLEYTTVSDLMTDPHPVCHGRL